MDLIALFRGINVGGRNVLPMSDLIAALEGLGCKEVRTVVQSGNAVFRHERGDLQELATEIGTSIAKSHGFEPNVLILTADRLEMVTQGNPYPDAESEPSKLHLLFLADKPEAPDLERIERLKAASERLTLDGDIVYLHAPDGIGRSKLAPGLESALGVSGTGRNWRTIQRVLEKSQSG